MDVKTKHKKYNDYKTQRQWAKEGYLAKPDVKGTELWANRFCQLSTRYYSPDEVEPATKEQLDKFFEPERQRNNERDKGRRKIRTAMKKEWEREEMLNAIEEPLRRRIRSLECIIRTAKSCVPNSLGDKTIIVDLKTTGVDTEMDEILHIGIVDADGNELYNRLFCPSKREWDLNPKSVTGNLSADKVINGSSIENEFINIQNIINEANTIVCYSSNFVLGFLANAGIRLYPNAKVVNLMEGFSRVYGERSDYYGGYKYQTLLTALFYYRYKAPLSQDNTMYNSHAIAYLYPLIQLDVEALGKKE